MGMKRRETSNKMSKSVLNFIFFISIFQQLCFFAIHGWNANLNDELSTLKKPMKSFLWIASFPYFICPRLFSQSWEKIKLWDSKTAGKEWWKFILKWVLRTVRGLSQTDGFSFFELPTYFVFIYFKWEFFGIWLIILIIESLLTERRKLL